MGFFILWLCGSVCGPAVFRSRHINNEIGTIADFSGSTPLRIDVVCGGHAGLKRVASPLLQTGTASSRFSEYGKSGWKNIFKKDIAQKNHGETFNYRGYAGNGTGPGRSVRIETLFRMPAEAAMGMLRWPPVGGQTGAGPARKLVSCV